MPPMSVEGHLICSLSSLFGFNSLSWAEEVQTSVHNHHFVRPRWRYMKKEMTFMLHQWLLNGGEHMEPILISLCYGMGMNIILTTSQVCWIRTS